MTRSLHHVADHARWILRAWEGKRRWLWVLLALTVLSAGATVAYPLVFRFVLDQLATLDPLGGGGLDVAEVHRTTWRVLLALGAIGLVRLVVGFYPAFRALVNNLVDLDIRSQAFAGLLRKGSRFFATFRTGDLVTRLIDDIVDYPRIAWFCCSGLFRALESGTRVLLCLGVMVWLDPTLALASLLPLPLMIVVFFLLEQRLGRATRAQREATSETSARLEAAFSGVMIVQAHEAGNRIADQLREQLEDRRHAEVNLERTWVLFSILFQSLSVVGQVVVVALGGLRVLQGDLTVGTFVAFYLYLELLLPPLMDLPNLFVTGRQAFVCMDRLDELAAFDREGEGGACQGRLDPGPGARLRIQAARFSYPPPPGEAGPGREVLRGVTLDLQPGEKVALVGPIGAGKSTLVQLAAGLLSPGAGELRLGGHPYPQLDADRVRRRVGLVLQEPVLFSLTVRENLLLGRPEEPGHLEQVLHICGLDREVAALPGGLDHLLGERGLGLSGGQRHRLAVARALYGRPDLLLLDDITAALDADNEERLWEELLAAAPQLTALVVTHRAATARRLDRTLVLEEGQITARGTHEELLTRSAYYRAFCAGHPPSRDGP